MTGRTRLLVLVDGSERTIQTARYLTGFMPVDAQLEIVLFHVFQGVPEEFRKLEQGLENLGTADQVVADQLRKQELEEKLGVLTCLQEAKRLLVAGGFPEDKVEIKFQRPNQGVARDIIEEARNGYDAVVMRRRGLGALKNMILGSVAVKLLQSLTFVPLILVGQAPPTKKVLLAVDYSPPSLKALNFAASLLGGGGYAVQIFHAIEGLGAVTFDLPQGECPKPVDEALAGSGLQAFKARVAQLFHTARELLLASGFEAAQISQRVISGVRHRADAIITEAERGEFGTIVVGRRGLSRVDAFFMGRVSHAVVYAGNHFSVWVV